MVKNFHNNDGLSRDLNMYNDAQIQGDRLERDGLATEFNRKVDYEK